MFCQKCGKEIPDGTKFCNFCGGEQNASAPVTNTPQNVTSVPKKNMNLIIIIAVAVVAFVVGVFIIAPSLSKGEDTNSTSSPSGALAGNIDLNSNNNSDKTPSLEDNSSDDLTLESLVPQNSDDRVGDVYSASLGEGGVFTLSFGYYLDSPKVVYDFNGSIEMEKSNPSYNELKKECEKFEDRANKLNDSDNVSVRCRENNDGLEVLIYIANLADADRLERVNFASDFIGINDTDGAFYFDSVVSQLTAIGFERGIPNK